MDLFIRNEMLRIFQTITFSSFMLHNVPITATIKVLKPFFQDYLTIYSGLISLYQKLIQICCCRIFKKVENFSMPPKDYPGQCRTPVNRYGLI